MHNIKFFNSTLLTLSLFLLFISCSDNEPMGVKNKITTNTGQAVVYLPKIPDGFLAKPKFSSLPNSLSLVITGDNMDTIKYCWFIDSMPVEPVIITDIPAGENRNFEGFLTNNDGTITHSGLVTTEIKAGETVDITLRLNLLDRNGDAVVCIEIEGLPSNCNPDPVKHCYRFTGILDTFEFIGNLKLANADDSIIGEITIQNWMGDTFFSNVTGLFAFDTFNLYTEINSELLNIKFSFIYYDLISGIIFRPNPISSFKQPVKISGSKINCAPNDTIPNDTIPNDTIPNDTIPNDTIPNDTIPNDTILKCFSFQGNPQPNHEFTGEASLVIIDKNISGSVFLSGWNNDTLNFNVLGFANDSYAQNTIYNLKVFPDTIPLTNIRSLLFCEHAGGKISGNIKYFIDNNSNLDTTLIEGKTITCW